MTEIVEKAKPGGITPREAWQRFLRHENGVLALILLALIAGFGGMTKGLLVTRNNVTNIILQSSERGVASIGQAFVILTAGIDLSITGVALLTQILGASLMTGTTAFPVGPIAVMLLVGAGIGAISGSVVSRIGVPALIVTLGLWQVCRGSAFLICKGYTIANVPRGMCFIGAGHIAGVPVPIIIFVAVAIVTYFVLYHTSFGRMVYAVGGNPVSAWLSGINVKNILFSVYVISGFLAALAGIIMLGRMACASMAAASALMLDSIAAVSIGGVSLAGGRGTLIGVIIGVMIIGVIRNGMNIIGIHPAYQDIVSGVVIITAVSIDYLRRR